MSTLIFHGGTLSTQWRFRTVIVPDAKSMNGGNPMLSTLPLARTLVNRTRAARRIAARIASAFVPTGHLAPLTHEALCYGCMAGIVMPIHHEIAPWDREHGNRESELNDESCAMHVHVREADSKVPKPLSMFNDAGSPAHRRAQDGAANQVLKLSHLVRHSQHSHFHLEIHRHELP